MSPRGLEDEIAISTELAISALGLGVGREVQTWIHEVGGFTIPRGWHNQISDGGELTAYYRLGAERRLTPFVQDGVPKVFEASADADLWLGYYTNASVGTTWRLGRFFSRYFEFASGPIQGASQAMIRHRVEGEWFAFASSRGRAVAYNALLQGQRRASVYTLSADEIRRFLYEFDIGVHASIPLGDARTGLYLTWVALAGRSPEIATDLARWHTWGSIQMGLTHGVGRRPGDP